MLTAGIVAVLVSQIHLGGVSFQDQARFFISNSELVLDLDLGIWHWRVLPLFSQIQRDSTRILHARMGDLPLSPTATYLCYFPLTSGTDDMASGLHLVQRDSDETLGAWGVCKHADLELWATRLSMATTFFMFPNWSVPEVQSNSRAQGWPSSSSDKWMLEFQTWLPPVSQLTLQITANMDSDLSPPDLLYAISVHSNGTLNFTWDDRSGLSGHFRHRSVSNVVELGRWQHVCLQKSQGANTVRVYLNGVLALTETPTYPLSVLDAIIITRIGQPTFREFLLRSVCPYPTVPFSPGVVSFASAIGDRQLRWNSLML